MSKDISITSAKPLLEMDSVGTHIIVRHLLENREYPRLHAGSAASGSLVLRKVASCFVSFIFRDTLL
jgi:hypothetical protein